MKKKAFLLFLCAAMVISTGCKSSTPTTDSPTVENPEDITTPDKTGDEGDDSKDNVSSTTLYTLEITENHMENLSDDNSITLYSANYDDFVITSNGYSALADGLDEWQKKRLAEINQIASDYTTYAKESLESYPDFRGYSSYRDLKLERYDNVVLSFTENGSDYSGGAHPNYYTNGFTFDVSTGEQLALSDIVTDYDSFSKAAINYILDLLKSDAYKDYTFYDDYETIISEGFTNVFWYLTASGICIIYNPYEIAPYAAGKIEILLPDATFSSYLKEKYLWNNNTGCASLRKDETIILKTSFGEYPLSITDGTENYDLPDGYTSAFITFNGTDYSLNTFGPWIKECFLIQQPSGRTLIIATGDLMSDDYTTRIFEVEKGFLKEYESIRGYFTVPGMESLKIFTVVDVLGSYRSTVTYDISQQGAPVFADKEYLISSTWEPLTLIKELPALYGGEEMILPVGTQITPIATDNMSYVRVKDVRTGTEYTLPYSTDGFPRTINGVDENEYFHMLPYAG